MSDKDDFYENDRSRFWRTLSDEELNEISNSVTTWNISESRASEAQTGSNTNDSDMTNDNSFHHAAADPTKISDVNTASASQYLIHHDVHFTCYQCRNLLEKICQDDISVPGTTSLHQKGQSLDAKNDVLSSGCKEPLLSTNVSEPNSSQLDIELETPHCSNCQRMRLLELSWGLQVKLLDAINQDDLATVRHMLYIDKVDPNFNMNRKNPICRATSLGNIQIMKLLLEKGANPDTANLSDLLWERRPIHIAASKGNLSAMQLLVENGANINQPDSDQRSPLHWVSMYGQAHVIKWMLEAGAKVNLTQSDGFTPLHTATCLGHREVCRLLISSGADMFHRDSDGWTPLHTAVCYGYMDIISLLLEKGACPLVTTGMNRDTTLHLACTKGRLDIVQLMLQKGVSIESQNSYGFTPLLTSVFYNRIDVAFYLVKNGANVNAVNHAGTSSIYLSATRCELELVKLLMCAGCRVQKHLSLAVSQFSPSLADEMDFHSFTAPTLRSLCLVVSRQALAPDLQVKAQLLPLPAAVKREVTMEDLSMAFISHISDSPL